MLSRPFAGRPTFVQLEALGREIVRLKEERGVDLVVFDSLAMLW